MRIVAVVPQVDLCLSTEGVRNHAEVDVFVAVGRIEADLALGNSQLNVSHVILFEQTCHVGNIVLLRPIKLQVSQSRGVVVL